MMPPQPAARLTSRQHPLVARFRNAARQPGDAVLIEGATLVGEARLAGWAIEAVAFTETALAVAGVAALFDTLDAEVTRVLVPSRVIDAMSPAHTPSGVVALARRRAWAIGEILARDAGLVVIAVDVQDPGNVGAIVRAAEAAGATGVIVCGASADPYGWKALRGAMGSAFRLPVVRATDAADAVHACRARGLRIIATTLDGPSIEYVALTPPCAVLVGAEGSGLPPALVDAADTRLTIPMEPPVASLNVAVAVGVILYEARRQRRRE